MKRVVFALTLVLMFCLMLSGSLFAEERLPAVKGGDTGAIQSGMHACSESADRGLLESIVDVVSEFLGHGDSDSDQPLENVHPADWNPPTAEHDLGDDDGWTEAK